MPPKLKQMADQLISTPSVSSTMPQYDQSNDQVIALLGTWFEDLGFEISVDPIVNRPGKANLIARRGTGTGGLLLSGHSDTVPLDEDLWQVNPFGITERDERWYGLGSCDMKTFFALIIEAVSPLLSEDFARPLTIVATADEESSMSGARALTAAALGEASIALIGEPTGLRPVHKHKGIMMISARVRGTSGHSSDPSLGQNALDASAILINELIGFRDRMASQFTDKSFHVCQPTLNLGCIHGGDNPNRICDHVDLAFDLRVLPGMDNDAVLAELKESITPKLAPLVCEIELLHPAIPPFYNDRDDLLSLTEKLTGHVPEAVAFATEAPFLEALGIPTIVMGPGSINQAHQPNEFLPLEHIDPAVAIIRRLIADRCLD